MNSLVNDYNQFKRIHKKNGSSANRALLSLLHFNGDKLSNSNEDLFGNLAKEAKTESEADLIAGALIQILSS